MSFNLIKHLTEPMQKNNAKLAFNFSKAKAYNDKTRGVEIKIDPNTGDQTIYARLYRTYIAKIENNKLHISHGNWPTVTTTKAINACLFACGLTSWRYSRRKLFGPNKTCIKINADWTAVELTAGKYLVS